MLSGEIALKITIIIIIVIQDKGTIVAFIIVRRIQGEYMAKQWTLYICFVDLEKAFDRVPRKVEEWAMRKKVIPEALFSAVMSLSKVARTKVKVGTYFSEVFEVNIEVHQGSALSPLLLTIVVDVITSEIKEGMLQEILCADDIVLIARPWRKCMKNFMVDKVHLRVNSRKCI